MPPHGSSSTLKLTPLQQRFAEEYAKDGNARGAAARAGYKGDGNSMGVTGHRLLQNPAVAAAIQAIRDGVHERVAQASGAPIVDAERVLAEVGRIAYSDPLHALNEDGTPRKLSEIPEDTRRAISQIKVRVDEKGASVVEFKFWDKPKGLEMLGKRLKLFTDKVEVTGEGGEPLQIVVQTYKDGGDK